jgi:predicted membrane channel-forming protein YqfA (hemolysin III family)
LGDFGNEYVVNLHWLVGLAVYIIMAAPVFGYFFNKLMDNLSDHEHTSMYVAIGNFITICFGALISWKAGIFFLILFALTGLPMIIGEYKRTWRKAKTLRVKRLPYKVTGLIDDAIISATRMNRLFGQYLESNDAVKINQIQNENTNVLLKLLEARNIQSEK